jgi:hypothetical protein
MWWDGGDRAITAREKATIEEHGPSGFSIALVPVTDVVTAQNARAIPAGLDQVYKALDLAADGPFFYVGAQTAAGVGTHFQAQPGSFRLFCGDASFANANAIVAGLNWLRENREALTATCKQPLQVSEVQGDALSLADHITDHLCHHEYDIGGRSELLACVTEALAARQPGAQEPRAWLIHWSHIPLEVPEVTTSASRVDAVSALTDPPRIEPLYAAPPAQGIDLGPVREFLRRRMAQWRSHLPSDPGAPGTVEIRGDGEGGYNNDVRMYREGIALMDRVLALIDDQRDAAPGVDRG